MPSEKQEAAQADRDDLAELERMEKVVSRREKKAISNDSLS